MSRAASDERDERVSGRALQSLADLADRRDLDPEALVAGLGLPPTVLRAPPARLSWAAFAALTERVAAGCSREDLRGAGQRIMHLPDLGGLPRAASLVASPGVVFRLAPSLGLSTLFPMVEGRHVGLSATSCRIEAHLPSGYTPSPAFFEIAAGNFEAVPTLLGLPPAAVDLQTDGTRAVYTIVHAPSRSLWSRLVLGWRALFRARDLLDELTARNEELARELARANAERDRAQAAIRSQSALVEAVSHELRTPLTAVLGLIDLSRQGELPASAAEHLDVARREARGLLRTVDGLLMVGVLGDEARPADPVPLDLGELVRDVVTPYRDTSRVSLRLALPEPGSAAVCVDQDHAVRVVDELVRNAVTFTGDGEVVVTLDAEDAGEGHVRVRLIVEDTGVGIPADWHQRVFEPFVQREVGLGRRARGVGLGLTLVQSLVDHLDGEVRLRSQEGRGTTVQVDLTLPRSDADADELDISRVDPLDLPTPPPSGEESEAAAGRVLVVDDNPVNRLLLRRIVEQLGLAPVTVDSGEAALAWLAEHPVDVVLMDVQMPGMSGLEATERLRADPNLAGLPVVAVTAQVAPGDRARCLGAGMDAYVPKPISADRLAEAIEAAAVARGRVVQATAPQRHTEPL